MSTESLLLESHVRHQVYLERYKSGEQKKLVRFVKQAYVDYRRLLIDADFETKLQLKKVLKQIDEVAKELKNKTNVYIDGQVEELGQVEAAFAQKSIDTSTTAKLAFTGVTVDQLRAAALVDPFEGKSLKRHVQRFTAAHKKVLKQKIRSGFAAGLTTQEIAKSLSSAADISERQAVALARTSLQHIADASKKALYKENSDIVEKIKYTSVLDGRTTFICSSRDGREYIQSKAPGIPAHWQCRSFYLPVLKKELLVDDVPQGYRAAKEARPGGSTKSDTMGTRVKAGTTHDQWLRRQPSWFVEDVMGKERAKLFLDGGLDSSDFVKDLKDTHKVYTLPQLKKLHPGAYEKSGLKLAA